MNQVFQGTSDHKTGKSSRNNYFVIELKQNATQRGNITGKLLLFEAKTVAALPALI